MTENMFVRKLPKPMKAQFRAKCASRGQSMRTVIEALMRAYIKDPEIVEEAYEIMRRIAAKGVKGEC